MTGRLKKDLGWNDYQWVKYFVHVHGGHDPTVIRDWPPRDLWDAYYDLRVKQMLGGS